MSKLYYLQAAQASSFLLHFLFLSTVSKATFGKLHLTAQPLCDLRDAMPSHWSPSASHPTLTRETEDLPRGGKYSKDVLLPILLAYLQQV